MQMFAKRYGLQQRFKVVAIAAFMLGTMPALYADEAVKTDSENRTNVSFHRDVLPIFRANCFGCHQGSLKQGDYLMTDFQALLKGGESGTPAIVAKKPEKSYLLDEITPVDGKAEMPKKQAPLKDSEIATIRRWIEQGASTTRRLFVPNTLPTATRVHSAAGDHGDGFFA